MTSAGTGTRTRANRKAVRRGYSLVEVILALLVFSVMVLGAVYYRYLTVLTVERARQELAAADLAVTLIETWQGSGGAGSFDPTSVFGPHLDISLGVGGAEPAGYTLLGAYDVTVANQTYQSTLYWKDLASDLRELGSTVSWPLGDGGEEKRYQLATYIRR
ncbi:MAG: prepilin-type N-terminal cleavage/methylation domain-containing protein [Phycisphaerales bacterium]|nr:MAG: prepilin-type N-terminal cleavage/methylation domain-containing protein [Phycisphaerales bacterium]